MNKEIIRNANAAKPVGQYSSAVRIGNLLIVGGNGPQYPESGEVLRGNFEEEVRLALTNMIEVVKAGGSSVEDVIKVTAYLKDINNFNLFNQVYSEFFSNAENLPSRAVVGVAGLWNDISVEVECLALVK